MDTKTKAEFHIGLLQPGYWPTWLGIGLWWLAAQLPFRWQLGLGRALGRISYYTAGRRRTICRRNIELCFPDLSEVERERLVRENMASTAMAVFETGLVWFASERRLRKLIGVEGGEIVDALRARGEGALLLVMHFVTLEVLGYAINSRVVATDMTYRPHANPVFDWVQAWRRRRHHADSIVIPAGDVRAIVRSLKRGRFVSHFPDQDYGAKHSVFAPFFGIPAATVTSLARLAKMAKVSVVPLVCTRRADGTGYRVQVLPPLPDFPSGDDERDAAALNAFVEARVREQPAQYLWVHRRFKTRPPGAPDLYGLKKKSRRRRRGAK